MSVLLGRLGLEAAQIPHADRHGLLWLSRGRLAVEDGNLVFTSAGDDRRSPGAYDIPYQQVSNILLGPGSTVSHDALRLLARHGTGLLAVGSDGVRLYATSMPFGPDSADRARRHARLWADPGRRIDIVRKQYELRLGESLPQEMRDINSLRGVEGARMKAVYKNMADAYGLQWRNRRYDRDAPEESDPINQALNHVATAMYAAARIAVAVTGAIPQLGFIHEASGHAFALDIADLYRASFTIPTAFLAARESGSDNLEQVARTLAGKKLYREKIIAGMIDRIKELIDDDSGDT